jgi:N-acetylglucosaminyldiphosphoundecaprenol N-acetyl-beta-D-mannosaminyltransferase
MTPEDPSYSKVKFFNLHIDVLDTSGFFTTLQHCLSKGQNVSINFLNAHCFNIAQKNDDYRLALEESTFLLNDGIGIDIAGKLIGVHFKENLNGTDLIPQMLDYFARTGMRVFCFGASKEVIEKAVQNIEASHPDLSVVGYCDGYEDDAEHVINQINQSQADAVILGMGVPRQELWVANNGVRLTSAKVIVSGGAIFDFISGNVMRAPPFIRHIKLEWLFRLAQEPVRLFSRYVLGTFVFLYYVIVRRH